MLCAERVLNRSVDCQRIVVCDSDEVESWSIALGVTCVRVTSAGLNPALDEARPEILARHPNTHLLIAHGDIISPSGLDDLIAGVVHRTDRPDRRPEVVIVPDRRMDGTNVLLLDEAIANEWTFEYGPGSFDRHKRQAEIRGCQIRVHRDEGLAIDLDTPDDLLQPEVRAFLGSHFPDLQLPTVPSREMESS